MSDTHAVQYKVDTLLRLGVVTSIVWFFGFGSLYAIVCGLRARRMIRASNGTLTGMGKVWWCLVLGTFGVLWWLPVVVLLTYDLIARR